MPGGFAPSPEKDYIQGTLWQPAIREAHDRNGGKPLRILCLPGRECRFLTTMLEKRYTSLDNTVCLERDPTEALIIRGLLADFSTDDAPVRANIVPKSVYDYLTGDGEMAVAQRFQVIDLDGYGSVADESTDVLVTVGAAIDIQTRANVKDWLLLLTTEVASKRGKGVVQNLRDSDSRIVANIGDLLREALSEDVMTDAGVAGCAKRFMAFAGVQVATTALPNYVANIQGCALIYRGTGEYDEPRALMGVFAVRLERPTKPIAGLGSKRPVEEHKVKIEVAKKCGKCRGVVLGPDGKVKRTDDLVAVVGK